MRQLILAFLSMGFLIPPAVAGHEDFVKRIKAQTRYYGVGWQRDGTHWSILVLLTKSGAQVAYPSLECTGVWSGETQTAFGVMYTENITDGVENCLPSGLVELTPLANGTLLYTWGESTEIIEARAVLSPLNGAGLSYMDQLKLTLNGINLDYMNPEFTD